MNSSDNQGQEHQEQGRVLSSIIEESINTSSEVVKQDPDEGSLSEYGSVQQIISELRHQLKNEESSQAVKIEQDDQSPTDDEATLDSYIESVNVTHPEP